MKYGHIILVVIFGAIAGYNIAKSYNLGAENQALKEEINNGHYCISICNEMLEDFGC